MSTVLAFSCPHAPCMRRGFVQFLQGVRKRWKPDRIVCLGDAADWHAISYHERNPNCPSAAFEFKYARRQVWEIRDGLRVDDWLIGNHDALTERQATTAGLPAEVLKSFSDLWEVPWRTIERHSELLIDGVVYMHGEGPHGAGGLASINRAKQRFRSVVMGHWHHEGGVMWHVNDEFRVFGLSVGCGLDRTKLQVAYGRPIPRKPMLGCGVVVDGKQAYFEPWCLKSR